MKKIKVVLFIAISLCGSIRSISQSLNWASLKTEQKHIVNINAASEFGVVFGAAYGYQLKTKMPIVLLAGYSFPSGENLFDDFKIRIGGQIVLYKIRSFHFSANFYGVLRRYENPLVSLLNFGTDLAGIVGYYKPKWFLAGEVGFDKAITTQFKHSNSFKEMYPEVQDGWYEPATGGNFYYGLQTGLSFKQSDITLKIGKVLTQDFKTTPLIPYYAQLGFNWKINER